jgi:hypothetical protein
MFYRLLPESTAGATNMAECTTFPSEVVGCFESTFAYFSNSKLTHAYQALYDQSSL